MKELPEAEGLQSPIIDHNGRDLYEVCMVSLRGRKNKKVYFYGFSSNAVVDYSRMFYKEWVPESTQLVSEILKWR